MSGHSDNLRERVLAAELSVCRLPRDAGESCLVCEERTDAVLDALGLSLASCHVCGCGMENRPLYHLGAGCYDEGAPPEGSTEP